MYAEPHNKYNGQQQQKNITYAEPQNTTDTTQDQKHIQYNGQQQQKNIYVCRTTSEIQRKKTAQTTK